MEEIPLTRTDICNLALSYLSKGRITDLKENTEEARQCNLHYEHCRRMLLRSYTWGFAKRTVKLAVLADTYPGWDYVYAYPAQCLEVRFVFNDETAQNKEQVRNEFDMAMTSDNTKTIVTNIENACCEYTADVETVDVMSEEFVEAMARSLASSMAMVLTGNANIMQTNYQLFQAAASSAKVEAATERERETGYPTKYAEARFS
jgi:hypothetical protein